MYLNTHYSCRNDNHMSGVFFFKANQGVKQGDNLSPILFNIFIDNFSTYFDNCINRSSLFKQSGYYNHYFCG